MMTMKSRDLLSLKVIFALLALGFCTHIILGLYAMLRNSDGSRKVFRMKSRYQPMESEIRGATYRSRGGPLMDMRFKAVYDRRRASAESWHPHFMARRDILETAQRLETGSSNPPSDFVNTSGEDVDLDMSQCNTCSIVGITGTLIEWGLGDWIDQSDCVIRLGLSPTNGFENDVGRKTTIRVLDAKSIYPLLIRPQRFMRSRLEGDSLVIFNTRGIEDPVEWRDRMRIFASTTPNADKIYILSKAGEHKTLRHLQKEGEKLGYSMLGYEPSALWHAVRIAEQVGCVSYQIVGVPDNKFCKRNMNSDITARYWDRYAPSLCRAGGDVGLGQAAAVSNSVLPSLSDRRAVLAWSRDHNVTFDAPPWPNMQNVSSPVSLEMPGSVED